MSGDSISPRFINITHLLIYLMNSTMMSWFHFSHLSCVHCGPTARTLSCRSALADMSLSNLYLNVCFSMRATCLILIRVPLPDISLYGTKIA